VLLVKHRAGGREQVPPCDRGQVEQDETFGVVQVVVQCVAKLKNAFWQTVGEAASDLASPVLDDLNQIALLCSRQRNRCRRADRLEGLTNRLHRVEAVELFEELLPRLPREPPVRTVPASSMSSMRSTCELGERDVRHDMSDVGHEPLLST
jgi:hypothetical protein